MLVKTITYTDYNGNERTEDFRFQFTESELTEMELSKEGGLSDSIVKIINSKDTPSLVLIFKDIILKAYGIKSDDGRRFIKSKEISEAFYHTEAYNKLFMELFSDAGYAANFIKLILPQKYIEKISEISNKSENNGIAGSDPTEQKINVSGTVDPLDPSRYN